MSLFKKDYFNNHNNRILFFNETQNESGRTLLSRIKKHHSATTLGKLLQESKKKTCQLDDELRAAKNNTASMKKQAVQAIDLAANTAAAKTSLHFRERERELKQQFYEEQNVQCICFLANHARKQMQTDSVNKHLSEIDALKIQLKQQQNKNRHLEAKHAKQSLEQLRAHHLSLGRAIASGSRLCGLAAAESPLATLQPHVQLQKRSHEQLHEEPHDEQLQEQPQEQPEQLANSNWKNTSKVPLLFQLKQNRSNASIKIQKILRSYVAVRATNRLRERKLYIILIHWGATVIQKFFRGRLGRFQHTRLKWRVEYKKVWRSAFKIQAKWLDYYKKNEEWKNINLPKKV